MGTLIPEQLDRMTQLLEANQPAISRRDQRYSGRAPLRYATSEIEGDLKYFHVNLCRLAVDAVAERMRIKSIHATVGNRPAMNERITSLWLNSSMDQLLQPLLVDALALGSAYLIVWTDAAGNATMTPESAKNVAVTRDPVTREVTAAVKRWNETDAAGAIVNEFAVLFGRDRITHYRRRAGAAWAETDVIYNPLDVVPVVPLINFDRISQDAGHSVIDDMSELVDALSKILADMLVASEDVARPRRWATGVELEEDYDDGFSADDPAGAGPVEPPAPAVSPFEAGNRMFTVESPEAKFGQLPGADLKGYDTAVDLLLQQIMAVTALPAHMVGITTANPASADGMRAAEASLTARAESRINVLGISLEYAARLLLAIDQQVPVNQVSLSLKWASASTRSTAQEADAVTKLHALGIIDTGEAREIMGIDQWN